MKPDFIVIMPSLGVLTIEVKSWHLDDIQSANKQIVTIKDRSGLGNNPHPTAMGRNWKKSLLDFCRQHPGLESLFYQDGPHEGNFALPFGHLGVFTNIQSTQFVRHARAGFWRDVFPPHEIVTRDTLELWKRLDIDSIVEKLKAFFVPSWPVNLSAGHINAVRAALHPETAISSLDRHSLPARQWNYDLKVLDVRQEWSARQIGGRPRALMGLVGSGKTVLLMARARTIIYGRPRTRLLFLCYNIHQAALIRAALSDLESVTVIHFHGWAESQGVVPKPGESNVALGQRLYDAFEQMGNRAPRYDAVLVDQGQDFAPEWFRCIVRSMAYPLDGDLLIAADGNQRLEGAERPWRWGEAGVQAEPRTTPSSLDLDWNYRNSAEVIGLASLFATSTALVSDDERLALPSGARSLPVRTTGHSPQFLRCNDPDHERRKTAQIARDLVNGRWLGQAIPPLRPEQIGIVYPFDDKAARSQIEKLAEELKDLDAVWLDRLNPDGSSPIQQPGVKIQSIRASRGLGYAAVIFLFADALPRPEVSEEVENRFMYVALTRASDYLTVICSGESRFVDRMLHG